MPDTASITIVKRFPYRGVQEEFSNTYHFEGTTPANRAAWKTLADAIITAEKTCVTAQTSFQRAYGYEPGNENSVAQIVYDGGADGSAAVGTYSSSGQEMPGDVAATIRWYTGASSSRGKRIYCRKYYHDVFSTTGEGDTWLNAQKTLYLTFAAKLIDGTLPGSFKYCGPQGADLSSPEASQWLTTRTLKRRGKRPPT